MEPWGTQQGDIISNDSDLNLAETHDQNVVSNLIVRNKEIHSLLQFPTLVKLNIKFLHIAPSNLFNRFSLMLTIYGPVFVVRQDFN